MLIRLLVLALIFAIAAILVQRLIYVERRPRRKPAPPAQPDQAHARRRIDKAADLIEQSQRQQAKADALDPIGPSHTKRKQATQAEADRLATDALSYLQAALPILRAAGGERQSDLDTLAQALAGSGKPLDRATQALAQARKAAR